jgi:hypothetical protein
MDAGQVEASRHPEGMQHPFPVQIQIGADLWEVTTSEELIGPAWLSGSP